MGDARQLARKAIDKPHWQREAARNGLGSGYICGSLEDMVTDVVAEVMPRYDRMVNMIRLLEWAGDWHDDAGSEPACPSCGAMKHEGHQDCELDQLLGEVGR